MREGEKDIFHPFPLDKLGAPTLFTNPIENVREKLYFPSYPHSCLSGYVPMWYKIYSTCIIKTKEMTMATLVLSS